MLLKILRATLDSFDLLSNNLQLQSLVLHIVDPEHLYCWSWWIGVSWTDHIDHDEEDQEEAGDDPQGSEERCPESPPLWTDHQEQTFLKYLSLNHGQEQGEEGMTYWPRVTSHQGHHRGTGAGDDIIQWRAEVETTLRHHDEDEGHISYLWSSQYELFFVSEGK